MQEDGSCVKCSDSEEILTVVLDKYEYYYDHQRDYICGTKIDHCEFYNEDNTCR